jgi:hypothetical protein
MRPTILFLTTSLVAISSAYAVDTAVPGATISTHRIYKGLPTPLELPSSKPPAIGPHE